MFYFEVVVFLIIVVDVIITQNNDSIETNNRNTEWKIELQKLGHKTWQ